MSRRTFSAAQVREILLKEADSDSESSESAKEAENLSVTDSEPSFHPSDESDNVSHMSSDGNVSDVDQEPSPVVEMSVSRGRGRGGRGRSDRGLRKDNGSASRTSLSFSGDATAELPSPASAPNMSVVRGRGRGRCAPSLRGRGQSRSTSRSIASSATTSDTWGSKDGTKWNLKPVKLPAGRQVAANVMHSPPGPTKFALRNTDGPLSAFYLFMRKPLLNEIMKWTNKEGQHIYVEKWTDVTEEEFLCFLGLLLLSGVYKSRNESVIQLWNSTDGRAIFGESMARNRFQQISRAIRFDDAHYRREHRSDDKLAPVRNVFEMWETTLSDAFVPSENVTVDEQLLTYRGRVPFKQYIPSKPGKYGIKLWMLCDSRTSYVLRLQVYSGRQPGQEREQNQGERVVLQLTEGLAGSGRNVTVDNFFCSLGLAQKLLKKKTTLLGTMRKNRKELPIELVNSSGREVLSSLFAFRDDATLVSYCPKKGKVVVLLSSMHAQGEVDLTRPDKKPNIILEYNASKGGVDTADQMLRMYSTKRMTRRWPMTIFYNMLDISTLNAFVIWMSLNPEWESKAKHRRRIFLMELGKLLVQAATTPSPPSVLEGGHGPSKLVPPQKRARCHCCARQKDRKSGMACVTCRRNVCKEHASIICDKCK